MSLTLVISPYDLSARSSAAVASLFLAERVLTLLPAPEGAGAGTPGAVTRRGSSAYQRLMESWDWTGPLWKEGVLAAGLDGSEVARSVRETRGMVERDPSMGPLLALMRASEDEPLAEFDALCRDLVLGGVNPSVSVPLTSAVEWFAARSETALARPAAKSLASRFERSAQRVVFRLNCVCVVEADAGDLVQLRQGLSVTLGAFRGALAGLLESVRAGAGEGEVADRLGEADRRRAEFEPALADRIERLRREASFSGRRVKCVPVTLTGSLAPAGSALRAAHAAAGLVTARKGSVPGAGSGDGALLAGRPLVVLTIKPLSLDLRAG